MASCRSAKDRRETDVLIRGEQALRRGEVVGQERIPGGGVDAGVELEALEPDAGGRFDTPGDLLGIRPEGGVELVEADPQGGAAVGLERGLLASGVQLQESLGTVHPEEVVDERGTLVIGRRPRIPVPIRGDQLSEGQAPPLLAVVPGGVGQFFGRRPLVGLRPPFHQDPRRVAPGRCSSG